MSPFPAARHAEVVESASVELRPASPSPGTDSNLRMRYGHPRTTTDIPRQKYNISEPSLTPTPAAFQQVVQYVSRGTQWYSPAVQETEDIRPDATSSTIQPLQQNESPKPIVFVPTIVPSPPTKPTPWLEPPSIRRRQCLGTDWSAAKSNKEVAPKRTSSATTALKILPAEYAECATEDLVALIASMIVELIDTNDALPPHRNFVLTRFHSR